MSSVPAVVRMFRGKRSSCIVGTGLVILLLGGQVWGFQEKTPPDFRLDEAFLYGFGSDLSRLLQSPASWKEKDFLRLTAVIGVGILCFSVDRSIHEWSEERRTSTSEDVARFGSTLGDGGVLGALLASLYVSGELFGERSLRKTALLSLESWLASGALVLALKHLTGRARPGTEEGPASFHPFSLGSDFHSFPSGHASSAFAVAAVVADHSSAVAVDAAAYSLATLVALSRVHRGSHWASDVWIGAAIGYFVGKKIASLNREEGGGRVRVGFSLSPCRRGITLSFSF